jgi:hypothetical protein
MFTTRRLSAFGLVLATAISSVAGAQAVGPVTPATPQLDFSGVVYGNYQMRTDSASKAATGTKAPNKFDVERVYLTFRMPAGDHGAIRVTTDIFNNANGNYYNGWTARLKYAYFQYAWSPNFFTRVGMLHTVVVDHEETFWPRWISQVALEKAGFFSSADLGVAGQYTLSNKWGEVYATITNGPGYSQSETDRFKDFSARLSLTPMAKSTGMFKTWTITPWYYKGSTASTQPAVFTDGLTRDRYGIFTGIKEHRLAAGLEWAQRTEGVETISAGPTQTVADRTGRLIDAFAVVRPMELSNPAQKSPFAVVARYDMFKPNTASGSATTDAANKSLILGVFYDLNQRASFSLDYQGTTFSGYDPNNAVPPTPPKASTIFAHWTVSF